MTVINLTETTLESKLSMFQVAHNPIYMCGKLGLLAVVTKGDEKSTCLTYYRFKSDGSFICLHKYTFDKNILNNVMLD